MTRQGAKILADLARHKRCFDLTDDGLGEALCKAATDGVLATIAAQQAPDGTPWDELSASYAAWKSAHYPGKPMGHLDDVMADPDEVAGTVEVTPTEATVTYGKPGSDEARRHAEWFSARRPFWGLTDAAAEASREILDARFRAIVG